MIFKEWSYECGACRTKQKHLHWDTDPIPTCDCGGTLHPYSLALSRNRGVIDDQIEGGPRWFETFGHEPVWIDSKSEWRRQVDKHQVVNVVNHEDSYYRKQRKMLDEQARDERRSIH